jgi:uncharacterized membrane protein YjgN (DUF898 family)
MTLIKAEEAIANVWIIVLIAIFGFSLLYGITYDIVMQIMNICLGFASDATPSTFYSNIELFIKLYDVLPIIFIFSIVLYAFVKAQKREYEQY